MSEVSLIDADLSHATLLACALDRVEWDRAKLRNADLRGSQLSGPNLAALADHAGLKISDSEQSEIVRQPGVEVHSGGRARAPYEHRRSFGRGHRETAPACRSSERHLFSEPAGEFRLLLPGRFRIVDWALLPEWLVQIEAIAAS